MPYNITPTTIGCLRCMSVTTAQHHPESQNTLGRPPPPLWPWHPGVFSISALVMNKSGPEHLLSASSMEGVSVGFRLSSKYSSYCLNQIYRKMLNHTYLTFRSEEIFPSLKFLLYQYFWNYILFDLSMINTENLITEQCCSIWC